MTSAQHYLLLILGLLRRRIWLIVVLGIGAMVMIATGPLYTVLTARSDEFTVTNAPTRDVAIVFGAGLDQYGVPSHFLESRLLAAVQLYKAGKAKVLLLSGDNSRVSYNEPAAMKQYVVGRGVPASAVVLDYAGFDTYDTCYRTHALFGVTSAILVTHGYHLPRALLTCNALGIKSVGVKADRDDRFSKNYLIREIASINKAMLQLALKVRPTVLGPQESGVRVALER